MRTRRLASWLFPSYLLLAVSSVAVVAFYAYYAVSDFHTERKRAQMRSVALLAAGEIFPAKAGPVSQQAGEICARVSAAMECRVTVIAPDGTVVADSHGDPAKMANHSGRPEVVAALAAGEGSNIHFSGTTRERMMYVALRATPDGAVMRTSVSLARMDAALTALRSRLTAAGILVALAAVLVSILMSRRLGRWAEQVSVWVAQYGKGNLEQSLPKARMQELDLLVDAVNDMAQRLKTQVESLTRINEQEQALMACMIEGVLAVDTGRRIIRMNRALADLFGVKEAECVGRNVLDTIRNADLHAVVDRALASEAPIEEDIHLVEPDRSLQILAAPLFDAGRRHVGAVLVVHDVTRLRKLETIRRDFVANVSHELKTPITSIRGFAETLVDGAAEEKDSRDRFLQIILRQSERLQSIVEDLLALAALDAEEDRRTIELGPGQVGPVIAAAMQACEKAAAAKQMALESKADAIETAMNAPLLEQAVINLLDNAIKYSPAGTVIRVTAAREGGNMVVAVADQGPGIPAEHVPRLFERFYRVDKGRSRNLGGTGLGLAIVKRVALLHGGSVDVKTELGKGSTFFIRIPVRS